MTSLEKRLNVKIESSIDKLSAVFKSHIENVIGGSSEEKSKIVPPARSRFPEVFNSSDRRPKSVESWKDLAAYK